MKQFSDWAEKGASSFLMAFGAAAFALFGFSDSQVSGAALVVALASSALIMIAGGVLRVWATSISAQSATKVRIAALKDADKPPKRPDGT